MWASILFCPRFIEAGEPAPLALIADIPVGGKPGALAVDSAPGRNDVLFYDLTQGQVRILDGDTLTFAPEQIRAPSWEPPRFAYDRTHHLAYLLTTRIHWPTPDAAWHEVMVYTIAARAAVTRSFSINATYNTDPSSLADRFYDFEGWAFKQPLSEGNNAGRLIVDNPWTGKVDIVDLDAAGTAPARLTRIVYRSPLAGPSRRDNPANSLALEPRHHTLTADDLTATDILYIADLNHPQPESLYALWLTQPPAAPAVMQRAEIPLNDFRFSAYMVGGLALADARDVLWVASTSQSFANGSLGQVDTKTNRLAGMIAVPGEIKEGMVSADWRDPQKVFICTCDVNDPSRALYLRLLYGGTPVASLRLADGYNSWDLRDMIYDPDHRRLYIAFRDRVLAVQVNYSPPVLVPRSYLPCILKS